MVRAGALDPPLNRACRPCSLIPQNGAEAFAGAPCAAAHHGGRKMPYLAGPAVAVLAAVLAVVLALGAPIARSAAADGAGTGAGTGMANEAEATAAAAETAEADLRARQQAVFQEMFDRPDDLDLMFAYALLSLRLEDLEAAISTLERMLIYDRELPRVHMELGAAYFRLGSYKSAKYYIENVLAFTDTPPRVVEKAKAFLSAIEQRTQRSVFVGSVSGGVAYASNATLGPDDPTVIAFGQPFTIGDEFLEGDDIAFRASAQLTHIYDLDRPNSDVWRTDASLYALHYVDETRSDIDSAQLRTGPQLALDDSQFGPKVRPFAEIGHVRSGNQALYTTVSGGAEFSDTLTGDLAVYGSLRGGYRRYHNGRERQGGALLRATGGAAYDAAPNVTLRGDVFVERMLARDDTSSSTEGTLRLSARYSYPSGFDFAQRLWSATGFAQITYRRFDEGDVQHTRTNGVVPVRRDTDLRAGMRHVAYLSDGLWLAVDVDGLRRMSSIENFDIDNLGFNLSLGLDF